MLEDYYGNKVTLALVLLMKEEINKLRKKLFLNEYTNQQVKTAFKNKLNELGMSCDTEDIDEE